MRCFQAPSLFVVRMDAVVTADGIFEPFFARVADSCLDLRAGIGFAGAAVDICHENHGGNLLEQSPIFCFDIWKSWPQG